MSRGLGKIERAITGIFANEPDNAFTVEDLAERIYGVGVVEKKHRVAVLRAMNKLIARSDTLACWPSETLGGANVYYDSCNVMSYAIARLKGDFLNCYRSKDSRVAPSRIKSEADLRAEIAPGGRDHRLVVPGGAWWEHTQSHIAEREARRAGDEVKLQAVLAERKARTERAMQALGFPP